MTEKLLNKGIAFIGENAGAARPIVVVGVARGGTSMVAGCLDHLGVFMGDQSSPPVYEDVRLSSAMDAGDIELSSAIAAEYSKRFDIWGWKRPASIFYLDQVHDVLQQPRYIFIFKDILSVAQRNVISMRSEVLTGIKTGLNGYTAAVKFLSRMQPRAMLVSYDKAMSHPENFLNNLIEFVGVSPNPEQLAAARNFIDPEPAGYLDASRITKAEGCLDNVSQQWITGWARYVHSASPASVNIMVNDKLIGTVVADQARSDLASKLKGDCAFSFQVPDAVTLRSGDIIRARVCDEIRDLTHSGVQVK